MKRLAFLLSLTITCGGALSAAASASATPAVLGAPGGKKAKPPEKKAPGPAQVDKKIAVPPNGLRFGMSIQELSKAYEKVFDDEFTPLYQRVEPGPRMNELDSELADKKQLVMRNKLEFGSLPSGLDNTPLGKEYAYNNNESMTQFKLRSGVHRHFFFMNKQLWKVYETHKLGKKSKLGADFEAVVANLTKQFGKPPRQRDADAAAERYYDTADWADADTIVRLVDHGNNEMGLVYVDRKIEDNIDRYRSAKAAEGPGLESDVSDVTRRDEKVDDKSKNVAEADAKKKKKKK